MKILFKIIKAPFALIWYVYCAPGYFQLWINYYFPSKGKFAGETLTNSRQRKRKHFFAPLIAIPYWFLFFLLFGSVILETLFLLYLLQIRPTIMLLFDI